MAAAAGAEFVEGWLVAQVLGEGAYGEVRLLVHARSGAAVALKVVRGAGAGAGAGAGEPAREAALHRALRHRHVLRCLGERTHQGLHYMFLEYARGGELFDRIEPDVGMSEANARRYWRQVLVGLEYLHGRGVAHRDIKPENLLLDHHDNIKISDFGMATLFRHGSRERVLSRVCGTVPYAAPEVLAAAARPYRAPPADLWAAALVLLAMLAGELPWERASSEDARYAAWARGGAGAAQGLWRRLPGAARALVARALAADPARRPSLQALLAHKWMTDTHERGWRSQPAPAEGGGPAVWAGPGPEDEGPAELSAADMEALVTHSQPAHPDDMLLSDHDETDAQSGPGHGHGGSSCSRAEVVGRLGLGRRLTRVTLVVGPGEAERALCAALQERGLGARRLQPRLFVIECGAEVRMRAWISPLPPPRAGSLVEFRRARGCGLLFKRRYVELRTALLPLTDPDAD